MWGQDHADTSYSHGHAVWLAADQYCVLLSDYSVLPAA
jgi:hypothetical protein